MRFGIFCFCIVLACGIASGSSREKKGDDVWKACEVDFKLNHFHPFVKVKVNGTGPYTFMLDNGYPNSSLTSSTAKKAEAKKDSFEFQIGEVTGKIGPYLTRTVFPDAAGVLGSDFCRDFVVTIDYPNKKLYVMDKKVFDGERGKIKDARTIKAEKAKYFLILTITLDGKGPLRFCHDTGTPYGFVLLPKHAEKAGVKDGTIKNISVEVSDGGKPLEYENKPLKVMSHGGIAEFSARFNYHGTVGNQLFIQDKITLDYEKEQIIVWPRDKSQDKQDKEEK